MGQHRIQFTRGASMDRAMGSVSMRHLAHAALLAALLLAAGVACTARDSSLPPQGVTRALAHVRGIT